MKLFYFIITAASTLALITVLNTRQSLAVVKRQGLVIFFSPQKGFGKTRKLTDADFKADIKSDELQRQTATFILMTALRRMFMQIMSMMPFLLKATCGMQSSGWQMDFQTHGRREAVGNHGRHREWDKFYWRR